jgi:hypothetical protein
MPRISRRAVLRWMASVGALPLLGVRQAAGAVETGALTELSSVTGYLPTSARVIGEAYLQSAPDEASVAFLEQAIRNTIAAAGVGAGASTAPPLGQLLQERITADFSAGQMVSVKGWMLARTEARLCALMALTSKASTASGLTRKFA